jgi:drug/metabolite transporter (DMT)-like permease
MPVIMEKRNRRLGVVLARVIFSERPVLATFAGGTLILAGVLGTQIKKSEGL